MKKAAIEGIKKRELKREEYIKKLEHQIATLEEQVSVEPPTANSELEEEIVSLHPMIHHRQAFFSHYDFRTPSTRKLATFPWKAQLKQVTPGNSCKRRA
jgi:hypothetical protein